MKPRRANDGRFVPRTGDVVLPPKPKQPRDEHGHFIPQEKVQSSRPYSKALRELLDAKEGTNPLTWDRDNLTEAQALAMVHISQAKSGNVQVGMMVVDRAEGKVPQAAEDREAAMKAGTGIRMLADLLGISPSLGDAIDTVIVPQDLLPQVTGDEKCQPSGSPQSGSSDSASSPSSSSPTEPSPEFSLEGNSGPK